MSKLKQPAALAIIPARGGSKGVPRKNIKLLAGKPLIGYTIEAAAGARLLTKTIVSTEDPEIANVARQLGADVPFMRPAELATDEARSLPVVQHAVREMERRDNTTYPIVVLLQPTTPMRTSQDIDEGIRLLIDTGADSVVSIVDVAGYHPFRMKRLLANDRIINYIDQGFEDLRPRQEIPPVYLRSGALYIARRKLVMEDETLVGEDCRAVVTPPERAVNIDTPIDFQLAEHQMALKNENPDG